MAQLGVITEQGDLGLGFDPLNNKDQKVVSESTKNNENNKDKDDEN